MNGYDEAKKTNGGLATAIGAAAVGMAVGAAAAYLSDKDKRDKLMNKTSEVTGNVKKQASELLNTAADKTGDALQEAGKKVKNSKGKVGDNMDDMTSSISDDMNTL